MASCFVVYTLYLCSTPKVNRILPAEIRASEKDSDHLRDLAGHTDLEPAPTYRAEGGGAAFSRKRGIPR